MRTWDDAATVDSEEAASLDYSTNKAASDDINVDLSQLVDENSRGAWGANGLYDLKDVDIGGSGGVEGRDENSEEDDIIARAIGKTSIGHTPDSSVTADSSRTSKSHFGTLASLFSRITGSSRSLTKEDLEPVLAGVQEHLMQKNVAQEIATKICEGIQESLVGKRSSGYRGERVTCIPLSLHPNPRTLFQGSKTKFAMHSQMPLLAFLRPRLQQTSCYPFALSSV